MARASVASSAALLHVASFVNGFAHAVAALESFLFLLRMCYNAVNKMATYGHRAARAARLNMVDFRHGAAFRASEIKRRPRRACSSGWATLEGHHLRVNALSSSRRPSGIIIGRPAAAWPAENRR